MIVCSLSSYCFSFLPAFCSYWVSGPSHQGTPALRDRLGTLALFDLGLPCSLSQFVGHLLQFQSWCFPGKELLKASPLRPPCWNSRTSEDVPEDSSGA